MKTKGWLIAKAVVCILFGIGYVVLPKTLASIAGTELLPGGALMAQVFGAAFIFEAIVLWMARNEAGTNKALRGIILGVFVSNAIGFVVCLLAVLNGVTNAFGWSYVGLYLVFGLAFLYFLVKNPE